MLVFWNDGSHITSLSQFQAVGQEKLADGTLVGTIGNPGLNGLAGAPTVSFAQMHVMNDPVQSPLLSSYKLGQGADSAVRTQGLDLSMLIGSDWWAPDDFWRHSQYLPQTPVDFFGLAVTGHGSFSMGASQYQ
jgi:hypothetical protein